MEYSAGPADALQRLRARLFGVVITSAYNDIDENLAFLEEMRSISPSLKCIVLAHKSTPDKVIAALRARVFGFFTSPFDPHEIAKLAASARSDDQSRDDIEIMSARPGWVSIRVNCRLVTADRLLSFAKELSAQLPEDARHEIFRRSARSSQRHGTRCRLQSRSVRRSHRHPHQAFDGLSRSRPRHRLPPRIAQSRRLRQSLIRSHRSHRQRQEEGMRAGGYGLLLATGTVDEFIYNEIGNEAILIKYLNPAPEIKKP